MFDHIVVPLDGSTFAEEALPLAERLVQRTGAGFHLVSVVDGEADDEASAYLGKIRHRIAEDCQSLVTTALRSGRPVKEILAEAETADADLIVIASHGRGGFERAWLGSTATGLLNRTDRPLLVARPRPEEEHPVPWGFARILLPIDGTKLSESALERAVEFGRLFGSSLHLVRVVAPQYSHLTGSLERGERDRIAEAERYLDDQMDLLSARDIAVTRSVSRNPSPARGILETLAERRCDAVVMATKGGLGVDRALIGSVADKVVRGSDVPVLLLPA